MVNIKVILNNMYIKNIIKDESIKLLDTLPKLHQSTLYKVSIYTKRFDRYYNTHPTHYYLYIFNNNYYIFSPKESFFINPNIYYYKSITDATLDGNYTMKVVINESTNTFYKININNIKTIYICCDHALPIYKEIHKVLKKYNYKINSIHTDCLIEDDYIIEANTFNEIFIDAEVYKKIPLYKKLFRIMFRKKLF